MTGTGWEADGWLSGGQWAVAAFPEHDGELGKLRDRLHHVNCNASVEGFLSLDLKSERGVEA